MLSTLLTVEDDNRISERSPQNVDSLKIVEFYCYGNHFIIMTNDYTSE